MENEVKAAKCLGTKSHPNIIQAFEHGALDQVNYFIDMELCDLNLREFLRGEKVKPDDWFLHWPIEDLGDRLFFIVALLQEIANGLHFIHAYDQVHRDLKPENSISTLYQQRSNKLVLYSCTTGWWKLTDFGLASAATTSAFQCTADRRATECYAPPEVLEEGKFNKKSDIWSLGCILFEVCADRQAFTNGWQVTNYGKSLQTDTTLLPPPFAEDSIDHPYALALNQMVASMVQRLCNVRPTAAEICAKIESTLTGNEPQAGVETGPVAYFENSSLLGTESPLWKGTKPLFEQIIPSRSYLDHPQIIQRRTSIMEARAKFLGRHHIVTAWTKLYLAWTMFQTGEWKAQAWTFLNIARNDIVEYHKGNLDQHPAELVIQSAFAHFSSSCNGISGRECFALVIDKLEAQRSQGRVVDLEHLFDMQLGLRGKFAGRVIEYTEDVVTEMIQQLPPGHPLTLTGRSLLGSLYNSSSQFNLAVETLLPVVAEMERVWGFDHSECLVAKLVLAGSYISVNTTRDIVTGVEYLLLALPALVEIFGPKQAKSIYAAEVLRRGMTMLSPAAHQDIIARGDYLLRICNL